MGYVGRGATQELGQCAARKLAYRQANERGEEMKTMRVTMLNLSLLAFIFCNGLVVHAQEVSAGWVPTGDLFYLQNLIATLEASATSPEGQERLHATTE